MLVSLAFGLAFFRAFANQRGMRGERCLGDVSILEVVMIEMTVYFLSGASIVLYGRDDLALLKLADELAAGGDFDRLETREVND